MVWVDMGLQNGIEYLYVNDNFFIANKFSLKNLSSIQSLEQDMDFMEFIKLNMRY